MTTTAAFADYLSRQFGPAQHAEASLHWTPPVSGPPSTPGPETVAAYAVILRVHATRGAISLGSWLGTDDGQFVAAAVRFMAPPLAQPYEQLLLVEALVAVAAE